MYVLAVIRRWPWVAFAVGLASCSTSADADAAALLDERVAAASAQLEQFVTEGETREDSFGSVYADGCSLWPRPDQDDAIFEHGFEERSVVCSIEPGPGQGFLQVGVGLDGPDGNPLDFFFSEVVGDDPRRTSSFFPIEGGEPIKETCWLNDEQEIQYCVADFRHGELRAIAVHYEAAGAGVGERLSDELLNVLDQVAVLEQ